MTDPKDLCDPAEETNSPRCLDMSASSTVEFDSVVHAQDPPHDDEDNT